MTLKLLPSSAFILAFSPVSSQREGRISSRRTLILGVSSKTVKIIPAMQPIVSKHQPLMLAEVDDVLIVTGFCVLSNTTPCFLY